MRSYQPSDPMILPRHAQMQARQKAAKLVMWRAVTRNFIPPKNGPSGPQISKYISPLTTNYEVYDLGGILNFNSKYMVAPWKRLSPPWLQLMFQNMQPPGQCIVYKIYRPADVYFSPHFNAFGVKVFPTHTFCNIHSLPSYPILHAHKSFDKSASLYIVMKQYVRVND